MDINRIISGLIRSYGQRAVKMLVQKGIEYAARRGKSSSPISESDRAQAAAGQRMADQAQKIKNAPRRLF